MQALIKSGPLLYFTLLLFPLISGADTYLNLKGYLPSKPSLILYLALFGPVFLKYWLLNRGQQLVDAYHSTMWVTVPFATLSIITAAWGLHPDTYWGDGGRLIFLGFINFIFLFFSVGIASSETVRKNSRLIFFIILIGASTAIMADLMVEDLFSKRGHRAVGFMAHPNRAATSILFMTIAAVNWKKNDVWDIVAFGIGALAIYATLSIGVLIFLSATVAFYMFLNFKTSGNMVKKLAFAVIVPLTVIFVVMPVIDQMTKKNEEVTSEIDKIMAEERRDTMKKLSHGDMEFATEHSRLKLILYYWEYIQDAPFAGNGTGFVSSGERRSGKEPHNSFIKYWVENGMLGFIAFIAIIGGSFFHFKSLNNIRGMVFAGAMFAEGFYTHALLSIRTVVTLLGLLAVLAVYESREAYNSHEQDEEHDSYGEPES